MTVTTTSYGAFSYVSGTIAEVLAELVRLQVDTRRVIWYTDDGTDARTVVYAVGA